MTHNMALEVLEFSTVSFAPCRRDGRGRSGYSFGVHASDGSALEQFAHPWCAFRDPEPAARQFTDKVIYGGLLMDHLGHFLLEAMSRLWFIREHPEFPIVWHWIDLPVPHNAWPGWLNEAWTLLGLNARRNHVVRDPIACHRVVLPQSGLLAGDALHQRQAEALACVVPDTATKGGRVWFSRAALPQRFGRIEREDELEKALEAKGWTVVRPETLSLAAKANVFAQADVVAGFAGSAFHAALLSRAPRARLILLERPSVQWDHYRAVAAARRLELTCVTVELEALGPINAWTTFRLLDPVRTAQAVAG